MPRDLALAVLDYAEAEGWDVQCYCDDRLYVARIDDDVRYYLDIANVPAQASADMRALLKERETTKLWGSETPRKRRAGAEALSEAFAGRLTVTISKPRFVEMLDAGVSKAAALAEVARRLGVPREQVLAIGDSFNDLDMIRWAGVGVAMGNASPRYKLWPTTPWPPTRTKAWPRRWPGSSSPELAARSPPSFPAGLIHIDIEGKASIGWKIPEQCGSYAPLRRRRPAGAARTVAGVLSRLGAGASVPRVARVAGRQTERGLAMARVVLENVSKHSVK